MVQGLLQLLLLTGILLVAQSATRQYHLIQEQMNWTEAQAFCRLNYVDLATVENTTDLEMLQEEAQKYNFQSEAWVGLYNDVNSWRCSFNDTPIGNFQNWTDTVLNNNQGQEECITIDEHGLWQDGNCSTARYFICYVGWNADIDKVIYVSTTLRTWQDAQAYCRERYTDLACPRNAAENAKVMAEVPTWTPWIGVYRDSWKWSDSTIASDIKWMSNQPDNAGGHDNCAFVVNSSFFGSSSSSSSSSSSDWYKGVSNSKPVYSYASLTTTTDGWFADDSCSVQRAFFCRSELKKKQIVRLVVQANQEVNDPAVKAAILDKIKEKLREQGMASSATVKWREQPDGEVFTRKKTLILN